MLWNFGFADYSLSRKIMRRLQQFRLPSIKLEAVFVFLRWYVQKIGKVCDIFLQVLYIAVLIPYSFNVMVNFGKVKVPPKVQVRAWVVRAILEIKFEKRRPYSNLCPQWCILCKNGEYTVDHVVLPFHITVNYSRKLIQAGWFHEGVSSCWACSLRVWEKARKKAKFFGLALWVHHCRTWELFYFGFILEWKASVIEAL